MSSPRAHRRLPVLLALATLAAWSSSGPGWAGNAVSQAGQNNRRPGVSLLLAKTDSRTSVYAPLETVTFRTQPERISALIKVSDGQGRPYFQGPANGRAPATFMVEGALGTHRAELIAGRKAMAVVEFEVQAQTQIETESKAIDGHFAALMGQILSTERHEFIDGRSVRLYSDTLRSNAHLARAMRFLSPDHGDALELFLAYQKDNGLLFSRLDHDSHYDPYTKAYIGVHQARDLWGESFTGRTKDGMFILERTPVEADIEALAVDYMFRQWQATGDDNVLRRALPALEKGMNYLMSDPLRWSEDVGLVKRGYSIDLFGFQHDSVETLHPKQNRNLGGWSDPQWIDAQTPMGIMHGDNSAMYAAATQLARLCAHLGLDEQAAKWIRTAEKFRVNLEKTAWNGTFYTHFVRLAPGREPAPSPESAGQESINVETNESRQLSMSNVFAINRDVTTHAQSVLILKEYQRRRERTRNRSLAEWFTIDPPFKEGFASNQRDHLNGTISTVVAGELALAGFRYGQEAYAVDVLRRLFELRTRYRTMHSYFYRTPRQPGWQDETFTPVDLRAVANRHFRGDRPNSFTGDLDNDLRDFPVGPQEFLGKPFDIIDPKDNGGRAAVVLWGNGSLGPRETVIAGIDRKASSIYFLHSAGNAPWGTPVGEYVVHYRDGGKVRIPVVVGRNINSWWADGDAGAWKVAWRGRNAASSKIAMGVWGWKNKHPEKAIDGITVRAAEGARLHLVGMSLSSAPVQWERGAAVSRGSGASGAASAWNALLEGVIGVADQNRLLEHVSVSPRWIALGEARASATVRYAASNGYVSYRFAHDATARTIHLWCAGSGRRFDFHVLLPPGTSARSVTVDKRKVGYADALVEETPYVDFTTEGPLVGPIEIRY